MVITVYVTHAEEDPYVFELLVDLSQVNLNLGKASNHFVEASYYEEGNNMTLGGQIVYDNNNDLKSTMNYQMNLDSSFQSTGSSTPGKPEFGKNVFFALRQFSASLPLNRLVSIYCNRY